MSEREKERKTSVRVNNVVVSYRDIKMIPEVAVMRNRIEYLITDSALEGQKAKESFLFFFSPRTIFHFIQIDSNNWNNGRKKKSSIIDENFDFLLSHHTLKDKEGNY